MDATARVSVAAGDTRRGRPRSSRTRELWWPAGHGDQPRYDLAVSLRGRRRDDRRDRAPHRLPHDHGRHRTRRDRHPVHLRGQRQADLRQGRELDPGRPLPHPHHPRPAGAPGRPGRRARTSTCCGCGAAASTRPTTSTTSATSAECWSGRTSRSPAPPTPRRSRCASEVEAEARENVARLAASPVTGAVERQQREPVGLRRLGLAGAARRAAPGACGYYTSCCPRSSPSSTRPGPTGRAARTPSPGDCHPNDADHGTLHIWEVWNQLDYTHYRDHVPRFVRGVRLPGPADVGHARRAGARRPADPDLARVACSTRRPMDGNGKLERGLAAAPAADRGLRRLALAHPAQPGPRGRVRHRALPLGWPRTARARSSGSSTTAGPSTSWAAVDGDGPPQAALVRPAARVRADRLLTVQPRDEPARPGRW